MKDSDTPLPQCSLHGKPTKRATCHECNAAYMRAYLARRRREMPARAIWDRARKRADGRGLAFSLTKDSITIPRTCPVLGIPLGWFGKRSSSSPSLDRVRPERGYVPGNVRVISDRANRLKGNRSLRELQRLATEGPLATRADYGLVSTYVEREQLLMEVRAKAAQGGRAGAEWAKIAGHLDRLFCESILE